MKITQHMRDTWASLVALPGSSCDRIRERTAAHPRTVRKFLDRWVEAGLAKVEEGPRGKLYTALRPDLPEPPPVSPEGEVLAVARAPRRRMWHAMRKLKAFGVRDITAHSSLEGDPVRDQFVQEYCSLLVQAGYLRVEATRDPESGRRARYRLIRDTGPRHPEPQRIIQLFDPNEGCIVWPEALADG